jgi:hypothetical protein
MIKRKTYVKRNVGLQSSSVPKRKSVLQSAPRSSNKRYTKLRNIYLTENPICLTQILGASDPSSYTVLLKMCEKKATTIHHCDGREGDNLIDRSNFKGLCAPCHQYIQDNSAIGAQLGYYLT